MCQITELCCQPQVSTDCVRAFCVTNYIYMKNKHAKEPFHETHVQIITFLAMVQTGSSLALSAKAEKYPAFIRIL